MSPKLLFFFFWEDLPLKSLNLKLGMIKKKKELKVGGFPFEHLILKLLFSSYIDTYLLYACYNWLILASIFR